MPRVVYIGRPSKMAGKRAFEVLANLKNLGVGRMLTRNSFCEKFPEKTFYVVKKVHPQMDDSLAFGRIWVEEVYRGKKYPDLREITPWHPDYRLIPREEEAEFIKGYENPPVLGQDFNDITILPQNYKVPPIMAEFLNRKRLSIQPNVNLKGLKKEVHGYDEKSLIHFEIPYVYYEKNDQFSYKYKVADEAKGEKSNVSFEKFIYKRFLEGIEDIK